MKRILLIIGLTCSSLALAEASSLENIRKTLAPYQSFQVEFQQSILEKGPFPELGDASGLVEFRRPHLLEWTYKTPRFKKLTFDGQVLTQDDGLDKERIDSGGMNLQETFAFMWGQTNQTYFRIEEKAKNSFRLIPKQKASFKFIDVVEKGGLVTLATVTDHFDSQTKIKFEKWSFQKPKAR